ncbi:amidase signature domain-containing protein [Bisporella sp. PMI_857]|nr:amidase signature domain-containing protein [Bisporella sp. PMI_857]
MLYSSETGWQLTAEKKRRSIADKIPQDWKLPQSVLKGAHERRKLTGDFFEQLLDGETLRITKLHSNDLLGAIRNRSLSAVEVTRAFCKRTAFAHQLNNNLLEIMFDTAHTRALELDQYLSEHKEVIGPLHGLPVTLKDQFHVKDAETTMGYVGWVGTFEGYKDTGKEGGKEESELVRELYELGSIPIAKARYTMNPAVQTLSCGGSSGGQGALLALRGSPIGFGTDIGGSVSVPAAFNGIYSIKPSHGPSILITNRLFWSPGQFVIPTVVGIMGESIPSLQLMLKSLLSSEPWSRDPDVLNIPWREEISLANGKEEFAFGLMKSDGLVTPHPPISRAIRMAIPWNPPSHNEAGNIHSAFMNADGGADVFKNLALSGEPLIPELQAEFGERPEPPMALLDFYNQSLRLKQYRESYEDYWISTAHKTKTGLPVEAVILPVAPHAAVIPGKWHYYNYGTIANTLDYSTVIIPVTTADKSVDVPDNEYRTLNKIDMENWEAYNAEAYDGAPASIQLLGRRLEEEKLLNLANIVVSALDAYKHDRLINA